MAIYKARPGAHAYGHDVGILMIECTCPFPPGDVGNASTYSYPVLFHPIPEVTIENLIDKGETAAVDSVIEAAKYLERQGVKAISSDCGYMIAYQDKVANAVSVPVMLSSLLQLSFISSLIPSDAEIGVICAHESRMKAGSIKAAWPSQDREVRVAGMQDCVAFRQAILDEKGILDTELVCRETVEQAVQLVKKYPKIRALLIECSNLTPYSAAVQREVGLPVFDFITMIDHVRGSVARRDYQGTY